MPSTVTLLGIPFPSLTNDEARRRLAKLIRSEGGGCVFTPNPQILMKTLRSPALRELLLHADLLLPDGVGVTLAARLRGTPLPCRITGIDTAEWLLRFGAERGYRFYFLGGKEGVAEAAARRMKKRIPRLCVVGTHHGYFEKEGKESGEVLEKIRSAAPDILFVCFGFPAQERWIAENRSALPSVRLFMGLGGSFDVWAGRIRRAPRPVQRVGMEWLWRALREPRRLKELGCLPRFLWFSLRRSSYFSFEKEK